MSVKAEATIMTEGKARWLVLAAEGAAVRERWPLHMDKLPDEQRRWHMKKAGERLHAKLKKRLSQ